MKKQLFLISAVSILIIILFSCEKDKAPKSPSGNTNKITFAYITTNIIGVYNATFTCSIDTLGNNSIQQHGFCWDTQENPDITKYKTELGAMSNAGEFSDDLTDLQPDKKYYIKAYITFNNFTIYSKQTTFTTNPLGSPTVTTNEVTNITANSAVSGGNITDDGGFSITTRGVCWSTSNNPIITDSHTTDGTGTGSYSSELKELDVNTTYYLRAYATNSIWTAYGLEKSFTTNDGIPDLTTTEITNITANSAVSGGNITDDGGSSITARGVCYSTSQNPTITDSHTTDGTGTGSYTSELTELYINTNYYIRAYATNSIGTAYGLEKNFTTNDGIPDLTTTEITNITVNSALSGGNISDDGGLSITSRGVCWNKTGNPTLANCDDYTTDGSGLDSYISYLTDLDENTLYYVTAYATNEVGTGYGNIESFTTLEPPCGELTVNYGGQIYNTVLIGNQCWFKENLNIGTRIDDVNEQTDNSIIEKYCYGNDELNCDEYGGLYQWDEMMQYTTTQGTQGICPDGWHLPTDDEWTSLVNYAGGSSNAGYKLKSISGWYNNGNGSDEYGFDALPCGGSWYAVFNGLTQHANFWLSDEQGYSLALLKSLYYYSDEVLHYGNDKGCGLSVRCVKD